MFNNVNSTFLRIKEDSDNDWKDNFEIKGKIFEYFQRTAKERKKKCWNEMKIREEERNWKRRKSFLCHFPFSFFFFSFSVVLNSYFTHRFSFSLTLTYLLCLILHSSSVRHFFLFLIQIILSTVIVINCAIIWVCVCSELWNFNFPLVFPFVPHVFFGTLLSTHKIFHLQNDDNFFFVSVCMSVCVCVCVCSGCGNFFSFVPFYFRK